MKRFVIGDIHGAAKALKQVLKRANFNYNEDLLITLGDIVDGWHETYEVVEELLKIKNRIDIVGNHDIWFREWIATSVHPDGWIQGGYNTAKSYLNAAGITPKIRKFSGTGYIINLNTGDIPEAHKKFFNQQIKYYKDDDNNIFVHGGFDRNIPIQKQSEQDLVWDRSLWYAAMSSDIPQPMKFAEPVNLVFIGHTSLEAWELHYPTRRRNIINLDTGAGWAGKLSMMNIDTLAEFRSDKVPELYPEEYESRRS